MPFERRNPTLRRRSRARYLALPSSLRRSALCALSHPRWSCLQPLPAGSDCAVPEGSAGDYPSRPHWVRWYGPGPLSTTSRCSCLTSYGLWAEALPPKVFFAVSRAFMSGPVEKFRSVLPDGRSRWACLGQPFLAVGRKKDGAFFLWTPRGACSCQATAGSSRGTSEGRTPPRSETIWNGN